MLQGVYIFWSFVCTRRVFTVVFGSQTIKQMDSVRTKVTG